MPEINQIISKSAIDDIINTDKAINALDESTKGFIASIELLNEALKKNDNTTNKIKETQKQNGKVTDKLTKLEKEQIAAEKALERQRRRGYAQMAKAEQKEREYIAALNMEVKSEDDLIKKTAALVKKRRMLDQTTKKGAAEHKRLTKEINKNTIALKRQDKAIGRSQRNVGNYIGALKRFGGSVMGALGITAGIYMVINGIKKLISISSNFEKALSSLSAITGAVGDDLEFFKQKAIDLSSHSLKSATDIVKAFELVGSIRPELLKDKEALTAVTKQSIILSEATGGKLGVEEAARATAGALNQYGLKAKDAARVVNVLAAGSKYGSAMILNQTEAIKVFGAIADAANIPIEQSVGLVETLAEKQILGAEAGTKLRNILIKLQGDQKNYKNGVFDVNLALDNLAKSNINVTELTKLFGKQNVVAAQVLLKNREKVISYTKAVTGTNTALEQQATQNNNLAGALTTLSNAWDAFLIKTNKSNGWLADNIRFITVLINKFDDLNAVFSKKGIIMGMLTFKETLEEINKTKAKEAAKLFDANGIIKQSKLSEQSLKELKTTLKDLEHNADIYFNNWKKAKDNGDKEQQAFWSIQYSIAKQNIDLTKKELNIKLNAEKKKKAAADETATQDAIIAEKTRKLFETEQQKELDAIDKKAEEYKKEGIKEVDIAKWVVQQKDKINKKYEQKERAARIQKLVNEQKDVQAFINWQTSMETEFYNTMNDLEQKDYNDIKALNAKILQNNTDNANAKMQTEIQLAQQLKELKLQLISETVQAGFEIYHSSLDRQMNDLQTQHEKEINLLDERITAEKNKADWDEKLVKTLNDKKDKLNKDYDRKQSALRTKQAKADKAAAMITAATNAALAIISAYTTPPAPVGIALGLIMGALAAVQIATIAAQPIPKFYKGTDSAPAGALIAGDRGRELIDHKGQLLMVNKPTVMTGLEGAKIYTNQETEAIMRGRAGYDSQDLREVVESNRQIAKAIQNQPHYHFETEAVIKNKGNYRETWKGRKLKI